MYISVYLAAVGIGFINTNSGVMKTLSLVIITTPLITPSLVNNAWAFKSRSVITKFTRTTIVYALFKMLDYNFLRWPGKSTKKLWTDTRTVEISQGLMKIQNTQKWSTSSNILCIFSILPDRCPRAGRSLFGRISAWNRTQL